MSSDMHTYIVDIGIKSHCLSSLKFQNSHFSKRSGHHHSAAFITQLDLCSTTMYLVTIRLLCIFCIVVTTTAGSSTKPLESDKEDTVDLEDTETEDSDDGASFGDSAAAAFAAEEVTLDDGGKFRRRPLKPTLSTSEKVVPIQLMDFAQSGRAPRRKNLHRSTLLDLIGDDFDPEWMSMDKPNVLKVLEDVSVQDGSLTGKRLAEQVQKLNVSRVIGEWLMNKARCPVMFYWEDVGPHFWPRWVKRGECMNDGGDDEDGKGNSCSWPVGMHCVPAESVMVQILRWHCRQKTRFAPTSPAPISLSQASSSKKQFGIGHQHGSLSSHQPHHRKKQLRCQWLKVPYPITARCFCSC